MSMTHHFHLDDLDQLLDSALDDFQTLNLMSSAQRDNGVKRAAEDSCEREVQGLGGMGLPDLKSKKKKGKQKTASETLNKLREQTKESVKGLESVAAAAHGFGIGDDDDDAFMVDDWVKQFEELTASSQELESMMQTMMQQILSKQLRHQPMKEFEEKYQKWLHDNKSKLNKQEYERQHNAVYESEPGNVSKIAELMQHSGQPPNDIIKDLAPPDFDLSAFGQLSQDLHHSQENCCIM